MAVAAEARDDRLWPLAAPVRGVHLRELRLRPRAGDGTGHLEADDLDRLAGMRGPEAGRLLARRALLRVAVGELTGCSPEAVRPAGGGGPRRVQVPGDDPWYVSVSSSGPVGVLALARVPVGVDVERFPAPPDAEEVSSFLLPAAEHDWIRSGGSDLGRRFLETWVRKEAVVKYTGEGLHRDLRDFVVDAARPSAPVRSPEGVFRGLWTHAVAIPGHAAALAVASAAPPG